MAGPAENLLSPRHRTETKENTFTKQRERSRVMQLQQRLQELKDRERQAQQHNNQLLQQFEKAQETLKEMLARNAAMKTIRMEYERYLEENCPRWQQQLQEKTQAAQQKSMDDCLRSYLEKTDEKEVSTSTVDGPLLSHGSSTRPQKCVAPQENSDYNQNSSSHHPFTQTHTGRFPGYLTAPHQSQSPCLFPPPNLFHHHSFLLQHLTSSPGQCQPWSGQDAAGWNSSQHNNPGFCAAAIPSGSLGQPHTALRVSQTVREEDETSTSPNSIKKDGGSRSLSPDLDVKPVRLFSSHAGSSESGRDSSLACMEKRKKKRGRRTQNSSSDSERSDSQRSSRTSSKIVITSFPPAQNSERNSSSEENSRRAKRGGGLSVRTSQPEGEEEETRREEDKESQHTDEEDGSLSEKLENESHGEESKSGGAEEPGINLMNETRAKEETDVPEGSSSEQSCMEEKDENILETGDEEENGQKSEKQNSDLEEDDDDEISTRQKTSEEEEEETDDQGDEEQFNNLENKDTEIIKEESASSQDEDESENSEDKTDEGSNKEEDGSEEEKESGDSEDIIISPQDKRSKQMLVIPEEAAEDEDESKTQSSNEFSDEDDIENLLAPLEQTEQKDVKTEEPEAVCHNMNIVQVTAVKSKTGHQSDSDEFDHFYD